MQLSWTSRFGDLKSILQFKKSLNLGDIPDNFQMLASKLSELEGTFTDGFDNNIRVLLNKNNWQLSNCVQGKPQIALRKHINQYSFDLHCFPIINGEAQAVVKAFHPRSGFKQFDPAIIGPLVRLPNLADFISMTIRCGDEADIELLKYADMLVQQLCLLLAESITIVEDDGQSIQQIYQFIEQQIKQVTGQAVY